MVRMNMTRQENRFLKDRHLLEAFKVWEKEQELKRKNRARTRASSKDSSAKEVLGMQSDDISDYQAEEPLSPLS